MCLDLFLQPSFWRTELIESVTNIASYETLFSGLLFSYIPSHWSWNEIHSASPSGLESLIYLLWVSHYLLFTHVKVGNYTYFDTHPSGYVSSLLPSPNYRTPVYCFLTLLLFFF